jgi:hypothetical protein
MTGQQVRSSVAFFLRFMGAGGIMLNWQAELKK